MTVSVNTSGMSQGIYTDTIVVRLDRSGVINTTTTSVTLNLTSGSSSPSIALSPTSLNFTGQAGGAVPPAQTISLTNPGGGTLSWNISLSVPWLVVTPTTGTTGTETDTISVTANTSGISAGSYAGLLTFSGNAANSPQQVMVNLTVTSGPSQTPALSVSPTSLSVSTPVGSVGPLSYHINVSNTGGGGSVGWTATNPYVGWLWVLPSGTTPGDLLVNLYPDNWPAGTYTTNITVTIPGATGSPQTIPVTMMVGTSTASVFASWSANTESDLAGYKIYYGTSSGNYTNSINVGNVTSYTVNGLATGRTYYFALSAYDTTGNESQKSVEVSITK